MTKLTKKDLEEAHQAIASTISKCEKVRPKLTPGTSQYTLLQRRIKAFSIALELIQKELESQEKIAEPKGH